MIQQFDYLVFIGRFQPFHNGHLAVIHQGLKNTSKLLILCGSVRQPRDIRNPWTVLQVEAMIRAALLPEDYSRVHVVPLEDVLYDEKRWLRSVQLTVNSIIKTQEMSSKKAPRIGLIGIAQRGENYYPNRFPQWGAVGVEDTGGIRATPIREAIYGIVKADGLSGAAYLDSTEAKEWLPKPVRDLLRGYCDTKEYAALCDEAAFITKYRSAWRDTPYPPTFVTVDAIVVQSGHVLLVERLAYPGKGLQALPGGFIRGDETLEDACIRELREETRLKVPGPVLKGSIRARRVFDAPFRSPRGRTITQGFLIELPPAPQLPKVKGGDDARYAFWIPLASLTPERLFEDHYHIIQAMI